jgi:hypothetical protein
MVKRPWLILFAVESRSAINDLTHECPLSSACLNPGNFVLGPIKVANITSANCRL